MQTNNKKNKIFIIWGLFITGVILILLMILLLSINKPQSNVNTQNKQTLYPNVDAKQEQETYNKIMNKIEKEVDELTKKPIENHYQSDGKTLDYIIYNNEKGQKVQEVHYKPDGKTIDYINDYDTETGAEILRTFYDQDGIMILPKES